jgi:hypothetical protein
MKRFELIHNVLGGPLPAPLARIYCNHIVSMAQAEIDRCGRCGNDAFEHVWILRDPDVREQDGVIDCERVKP